MTHELIFSEPKETQICLPALGEWHGFVAGVQQSLLLKLGWCLGEKGRFVGQQAPGGVTSLDGVSLQPFGGTDGSTPKNSCHSLQAAPGTLERFNSHFFP